MIVDSVWLYKTPLDPDYRNVFDSYNATDSLESYFTIINTTYPRLHAGSHINRSIKMTGTEFDLVIDKQQEYVRDANYGFLEVSDAGLEIAQYTPFFVLYSESLHDNVGIGAPSGSTRLHCKLDAFALNISSLKSSFDFNPIVRRHTDDFYIDNGKLKSIHRMSDEPKVKIESKSNEEYHLMWLKLTLTDSTKLYLTGDGDTTYDDLSAVSNYSRVVGETAVTLYFPFKLFRLNGSNPPKHTTVYKVYAYHFDDNNDIRITDNINNNPLVEWFFCNGLYKIIQNDVVLSAELTYNAPVPYHVEIQEGTRNVLLYINAIFTGSTTDRNRFIGLSKAELEDCPCAFGHVLTDPNVSHNIITTYSIPQFAIYSCSTAYINDTVRESTYSIQNVEDNVGANSVNRYSLLYNTNIKYEQRIREYPYAGLVVKYNGISKIIKPKYKAEELTILQNRYNSTSFVKYYTDANEAYETPLDRANTNGQLPLSRDQYAIFLEHNSNRLIASAITNIVRVGVGAGELIGTGGEKGASNVIGGITGTGNQLATIGDIKQTPDSVSVPTNIAIEDLIQDAVTVNKYGIENEIDEESLYRLFHYNGVNYGIADSISLNTHILFDYVQTANCNLQAITNNIMRNELESAYDRGITRWHLSYKHNNVTINNYTNAEFCKLNKNLINLTITQDSFYPEPT